MMYSTVDLLLAQVWQVTILIILALLIERLFAVKFPHLMAGVWLAVVIKCLVPPILSSPTGLFSWARVSLTTGTAEVAAQSLGSIPRMIGITLLLLWAGGAIFLTASWFYRWRRFANCLKTCKQHPILQERVDQLRLEIGLKNRPSLFVSRDNMGPLKTGILRPIILLPESLVSVSNLKQLDPVIAHELIHIRRRDSLLGVFQMVATLFFWFHPLLRLAMKRMDLNIERCVDSEVISDLKYDATEYAKGLLHVLKLNTGLPIMRGLAYMSPKQISKDRIRHVITSAHARSRIRGPFFVVAMILLIVPGHPLDSHPWQPDLKLPFSVCKTDSTNSNHQSID